MLQLSDLEPLVVPLSTCSACSGTNVEFTGIKKHLQIPLTCEDCGNRRVVIITVAEEGEAPCQSVPGTDPTSG